MLKRQVLKKTAVRFFLFLFLLISCSNLFAAPPPANDDPCSAATLVANNNCNYQVFTTVGATGSVGVPVPGCANYVGGDVWFQVVVPCTGILSFDTNFGVLSDAGMAIYTGTCTNLTLLACDDNSSPNGNMPQIIQSGLTNGTTIWIRLWGFGNGTQGNFGICVSIPPPPPPGASCISAQPFCTGTVYDFPNLTNNPTGLGGGGIYTCLFSTPDPVFYYMQIDNPGDLSIFMSQQTAGGAGLDIDFCCWGPFPDLASMCGGLTASNNISCSYLPAPTETCEITGAQSGEFYLLLITNFSQNPGFIHFSQSGGSASTTCDIVCNVTAANTGPVCPGQSVNLTSAVAAPIPAGAIYTWSGPNCFGSGTQNTTTIPPSTPGSYDYTITITNGNGTTCTATTTVVVGGSLSGGSATPASTNCPGANDGSITVTPPATGGPFTYTLSPGNIVQINNPVFTNLVAGTYSVVITNGTCSQTITPINVQAGTVPVATAITTNTTCSTVNDGTITITAPSAGGPFVYTLNPGNVVQNNNPVFTGLAPNTYTITFTTAAGCNGSIAANPVVAAGIAPIATAIAVNTSCPGADNGTVTVTPPATGGPFVYTLNPGNVVQNNNPVFTGLATNTYTITFTTALGCNGTVPVNPVVSNGPVPTASAVATNTLCPGVSNGTITITPPVTGGPFVYTLNPGNVVQNNNPVFIGLAAGTYTITFTTSQGCSGTVSTNPTINNGPAPTASAAATNTLCPGVSNGTITITPPVTGGPFVYTLNPGDVVQNNNPVFTGLATGTYTITFTTSQGCSSTVSSNPIISNGPAPTSTAVTTNTLCPGVNDGTITITPPIAGGPFIYTLNPGNIVQNNNAVFTGLAAGTYTITFTTSQGCSGSVSPNPVVNNNAAPTTTATTTNTACPAINNGIVTINPPAIGGPFVYTLNPGNVVQNNNPVFTALAPNTYTISFTTATGCNGTVPINPLVQAGPALTANAPTITNPPCAYINDGILTIVPSVAGSYTYVLNPGTPGQVTQANNPSFTGLAPGSYNYSFTNAVGCSFTGSTTLTTHTPLAISVSRTLPLCFGSANGVISLNASGGLAGYQYALSPFSNYQDGTFNGLIAGNYTFRVRDAAGCTKDTTVALGQPSQLTATAVTVAGTCAGVDGQINVTGAYGTPGYSYSIDGINYQAAADFIVSGGPTPGIPFSNVSVKDTNGCITTAPVVYVGLIDNMSPLSAGSDVTICAGQHTTFQTHADPQATIFTWTTYPDPTLINTLDDNSIKNPTATPVDTTTYIFIAQWGICSRTDSITVNILHKPIPNAGKDTILCADKTICILHGSATNTSGPVNFEWSDTTNLLTPHNANTIATPLATENFILTVTDNYGCNFSVSVPVAVIVLPPVKAFAGNDTIAVIDQPHQLLATGGVSYEWSPVNDLNLSNIQSPMATLDHSQLFHVTVTDRAGCVGTDDVYIQVYPGPAYYVPNAFSPNGDGLNDIFRIIPAGITRTDWFRIFNRFGELVFETNQWLKGWDGTFKGKKQTVGNYVWILKGVDKNNKIVEMKGTVMLVQ